MTDTAALAEVRRLYGLLRQAEDEIALLRQDNAQLRIQLSGRPVRPGPADREPTPWWRDRRPRPPQAAQPEIRPLPGSGGGSRTGSGEFSVVLGGGIESGG
ncbi:hypothetical protein [Streptacidiphilus pinicola]|uniref:hypothetical protein n=1 Tax=Streptacidiphilus pinicola TaxID=2219663 RepID=UPI0010582D69|nr:hypothetical protein [Streptacidiphilus pinicola]